ncbi:hypothetical protein ACWGI9_24445 [Streptomyces sp. NPDC054833]
MPKPEELAPYLALQQRIDHHLNPAFVESGYFSDLITVAQLIKISWPTSLGLAPLSTSMSSFLGAHIEGIRQELADPAPGRWRDREMTSPPAQVLPCAALLLQAEQLRSVDGPLELRDVMQTLAGHAFQRDHNRFRWLFRHSSVSEPLARALAPQRRGFHVSPRTRRATRRLRVPSRDSQYRAEHVPQLIPLAWYNRYFQDFAAQFTVSSRGNIDFIRRAASLKLVEMTSGGTVAMCAQLLDMPATVARNTLRKLRGRCPDAAWAQFEEAVVAIAHELEQVPTRTDFAYRRHRLARWEISSDGWLNLIDGLHHQFGQPYHRKAGSVLVWAQATEGDRTFGPLIRANGTGARLPDATAVLSWLSSCMVASRGGKPVLRERLSRYAEQVAAQCDLNAPLSQVDTAVCLRRGDKDPPQDTTRLSADTSASGPNDSSRPVRRGRGNSPLRG